MVVSDYLAAIRQLPLGSLADITGGGPIVVLSPHPDDESLGVGGLIGAATDAGQRVDIVLVTDGGASHPQSPKFPRDRLIDLRGDELVRAASLLGVSRDRLHRLDFPDARAPTGGASFDAAVDAIAAICKRNGAAALFVTSERDPHCDHQAAARMAEAVYERCPALVVWAYPVWAWHLGPSASIEWAPPRGFRLNIGAQRARKRAAIDAHASQMTDLIDDDPTGFRFTHEMLAPFIGPFEYYLKVSP